MAIADQPAKEGKDEQKLTAPSISLPKGGGAIRGMGEKFAANPVTGTGSMSVPIATSPGRNGFGPQLSLSYDSGSGNGPFGFGWSLSLPSITRKTDKGLPQYLDGQESDVFILSGAEDLVRVFKKTAGDEPEEWELDELPQDGYLVRRYRPRVEGLFARIERWTHTEDATDVHWRSISKDNVLTLYGKDENSRIKDPADSQRIFSWLICETRDDKGNAVIYEYKAEDGTGIDLSQANERNRERTANRYIKYIRYGNQAPLLDGSRQRPRFLTSDQIDGPNWLFEVVFDYGEGHYQALLPDPSLPVTTQHPRVEAAAASASQPWTVRPDPFSNYRAGFEVRTYRRCQRVLMFHNFAELVVQPYLVRSTEFEYADLDYPANPAMDTEPPVETELDHDGSTRFASFIQNVSQSGYLLDAAVPENSEATEDRNRKHIYLKKSLSPLQFTYSKAIIQDDIRELDAASLENLPIGLDGSTYQWVDLDGEGVTGILTEQANAWFYKPNLGGGKFGPMQQVARQPSLAALSSGRQQLLDLAGDGQIDLVEFSGPTPGFYERSLDEDWKCFRPFKLLPHISLENPNLRFVDLNGDGHADVFITEDQVFTWHPSLAEEGFASARRVSQPLDEEEGPRLVFADGTQSIYLADMCGDGLTALVRIRNGEVCYWPNLGYGRFGAKVTMDNAPWFDNSDQFSQQHIRLADIDGSGVNDIIYLHRDGVRLYFNQSGNRWSAPRALRQFPPVDNLSSVMTADLLGNGTACLVWSSPLPGNIGQPLRYIDLMGGKKADLPDLMRGQKPHLLITVENNLGAKTEIHYASSTKFYLADKAAGTPWITKLPFPVHVVEKVVITEKWRGTTFTTHYSYHHGYFDGPEREFRGFGRVEQQDVENYGKFQAGNSHSPYITNDQILYQPPVKTITWFHTGAFLSRERILNQFQQEYFPQPDTFLENPLPEPDLATLGLSAEECREALRACKGMVLRQEIYELDVDALEAGEEKRVKLFSTAYHNCHIQRLQPRAQNRHAVFLVTESEAVTYHYELNLPEDSLESLQPDPRIAHTLNLHTDQYGNVLESVVVAYPRLGQHVETEVAPVETDGVPLPEGTLELIREVQLAQHLAYTENRFTDDISDSLGPDNYRLPLPCEVKTYELTGIRPEGGFYHSMAELREADIKNAENAVTENAVSEIPYHQLANDSTPQKRCVEHVRILYFNSTLDGALPLGELGALSLPYETYKLALTNDLLETILGEKLQELPLEAGETDRDRVLGRILQEGGYHQFPDEPDDANKWWIRSGIAGFAEGAADHFYLPDRYIDPFDNETELEYGAYDFYIQSSLDPVGNETRVDQFDFRILAPSQMRDINYNRSEVAFDIFGLPTALALKGKEDRREGDLINVTADLDIETLSHFFAEDYDEDNARTLLGNATARHLYYFGEQFTEGRLTYGSHPACAAGLMRETHLAAEGGATSKLQAQFGYSDGMGQVLMAKAKAEGGPISGVTPDPSLRWITSGKTILNNKGKPVKQYEPYFSPHHRWDEEEASQEVGVTPILYYDAAGLLIRTEAPDGSYSRVEFTPWFMAAWDANDTVEPGNAWYERYFHGTAQENRTARMAEKHAATPAVTHLDSLGRDVIAIAHNRSPDNSSVPLNPDPLRRTWIEEKYVTYTKLDAEGKPLWIKDARGNRVMEYIKISPPGTETEFFPCYDIAGNLLFQRSMDGGDRWMLMDATGQPHYAWNENERTGADGVLRRENRLYHTVYDALRRPETQRLKINDQVSWLVTERLVYGESLPETEARERNLRGQIYQHYDPSGLITNELFDFKGNLLEVTRQLASAYAASIIDWPENPPTSAFEQEIFIQRTQYDALSRMVELQNWHREGGAPAVYKSEYNERGLLKNETLTLPGRENSGAIRNIEYDAKGQRTFIEYGNDTITRYHYDDKTFRLVQLRTTKHVADVPLPLPPSDQGSQNVLQNLYYTYDPSGNITEIHDNAYEPEFFQNQIVEPRSRYTYDALYRLIEANGRENGAAVGAPHHVVTRSSEVTFAASPDALRNYTQRYSYDSVGNIMLTQHIAGIGSWTRNYHYANDSNRLIRTNTNNPVETVNYLYDIHGSMLNLANVEPGRFLRWDTRDMIHSIDLVGGGWAYYQYDSNKQRTRKRIEHLSGNTVEERFYLGGMEWYRRWLNGNLVEEIETHHLFLDDQRVLIVEDVVETDADLPKAVLDRYQYSNHLGSVGLELDGAARIISYEEYHPYGTMAYQAYGSEVKAVAKRYRYTGMERDEESGLSYHTARYYLPWLGRWLSADPKEMTDGVNFYTYVRSQPICSSDSAGTNTLNEVVSTITDRLALVDDALTQLEEIQDRLATAARE